MKTREVADICGVSIPTITENAKKIGIMMEHGKPHEWTEDELKKIQIELMKNQTNQGHQVEQVKNEVLNRFNTGMSLMEIVRSGNVEAMKELMDLSMAAVQETARIKELEEKNKQLQLEVDRYVNWKSASEIKSEFKLPARPGIEKVALLLKLKENEDWITRSYDDVHLYKKILYSSEAVERIVEYIQGE